MFGGNLVEGSLPIGSIEAFLGSKHIRNADFGEDQGVVAHSLGEHAIERAFRFAEQVGLTTIGELARAGRQRLPK